MMWNIQPNPFGRLRNGGPFKSAECTWYLGDDAEEGDFDVRYPWNI